MTIHKSAAVTAGIMPDHARAGVVFCRSAEYTSDAVIACGDTIQMVPIPKNAKVLMIQVAFNSVESTATGCMIGYGGDTNAFADPVAMTADNVKTFPAHSGNQEAFVGFLHTFTADDTIDVAIPRATGDITAAYAQINMAVWYKMTGTIADET
jgi:hypothetical protein